METKKQKIHNKYYKHKVNDNMNHVMLTEFSHTEIPEHIFFSKCIQYLIFSNNLICDVPDKISNIINLRYVDISNNPLTSVNGLYKMKNLIKINIESEGSYDSFLQIYNNNMILQFNMMV